LTFSQRGIKIKFSKWQRCLMAKVAVFILGLLLLLGFISPVLAEPDSVKWSNVNIPTQGKSGGWVLASDSDIQQLTMAADGVLYAYGKGLTYTLYQSTDGGYSWSAIGKVKDEIVDIAIAPDNVVYYATSSQVFKSINGVSKFATLPTPGGADGITIEITSLDASQRNNNVIAVGTRNTDNNKYGGIYLLEDAPPFTWTDTNLVGYDVCTLAFSPNYPADHQLIAVVTDEQHTFITTDFGGGWGETIANAKIDNLVPLSASIAFPDDYDPNIIVHYFVAINSGVDKGDAYRVENSAATDLDIGVDVSGLGVSGGAARANLIAGAAASAEVYLSNDGGRNWQQSTKPPTGQSQTGIVMAQGGAYAATSGDESAFSHTTDGGLSWNQLSMIDTALTEIVDLAPSPAYQEDETLFMITSGGKDSLWRSLDGGKRWERLFSSLPADIDTIEDVQLPPQYDIDNEIVFIAGTANDNPAIWKSINNGQIFARRFVPFPINAWAVVDSTTLFVGSFDDTNGLVYLSTTSGSSYSEGAIAGNNSLSSIATSPDYAQDETILVGNSDGWVFWSEDNSSSFVSLPQTATTKPLEGKISVAFDPDYPDNNTVYAASDSAGEGIYRFIIGKSDKWENIDSPDSGTIGSLLASAQGTLYAANWKADGGMERCLNPTYPLGPTFETVTKGLDDEASLVGLWLAGNRLWSVDGAHTSLITYIDSLAQPPILAFPTDEATGLGTIINYTVKNISLDWERLEGATEYHWQLDYDNEFSSVPAGFEGDTRASSAQLPDLDPTTTYYWRVRASEPVLSPWSDKWSFTTSFGTEAYAPELESPPGGATGVPVKPIFQWSAVAGANGYELVVSTHSAVDNPTILKTDTYALPNTAWQANIELDYDTTYYWKVRAVSADTYSPWSAVSAFTTEPAPDLPTTQSILPASSQPPSLDTFNWAEWILPVGGIVFLILFIIMMIMLITMMIMVVKVTKL
jgi:photosystem II stability/assembly factor-like uncharacterized protein